MELIHISAAMSLDGYIDDCRQQRLVLSSREDLEDMYIARSQCDAILIGANTIRKDNPSLLVKSQPLIKERMRRDQSENLIKVTVTNSGDLNPNAQFFIKGDQKKIVICPSENFEIVSEKLSGVSQIIPVKEVTAINIVQSLKSCGINSLFVEGGTTILTMFLSQGVFHRLRLAIAPYFIGDSSAPRLVNTAAFINGSNNKLHIASVRNLGNMVVMDLVNENYVNG